MRFKSQGQLLKYRQLLVPHEASPDFERGIDCSLIAQFTLPIAAIRLFNLAMLSRSTGRMYGDSEGRSTQGLRAQRYLSSPDERNFPVSCHCRQRAVIRTVVASHFQASRLTIQFPLHFSTRTT